MLINYSSILALQNRTSMRPVSAETSKWSCVMTDPACALPQSTRRAGLVAAAPLAEPDHTSLNESPKNPPREAIYRLHGARSQALRPIGMCTDLSQTCPQTHAWPSDMLPPL